MNYLRINTLWILCTLLICAACGNNRKDKEPETIPEPVLVDSVTVEPEAAKPVENPRATAPEKTSGPGDILANINKYLVSTPSFEASTPGSEGITNCTVSIENKLDNSSFQKAIIEVSILLADGKEYRTDYYTVVNLEPGDRKLVKIPNTTRGVKVTSRIVKVKSNELTNGESVTVGNGYVPR